MEQIAARGTADDIPTVLYVDDEDMARKYFGRAFGNEYRVLTAPGVDAALALLAEHEVDVLVTDYRMPGKAGGELLREVERSWPGLVRILVTAYADKETGPAGCAARSAAPGQLRGGAARPWPCRARPRPAGGRGDRGVPGARAGHAAGVDRRLCAHHRTQRARVP
jgi:CheY-like chemotaxis protein